MSTTDTDPQVWSDRQLTPAQQQNRASAELIPFGEHGVTPATFAAAVDFAKMMSQAKSVVPAHLAGSPAACLAVIDLASKFQMSPYMLATRTLVVNGIMSFDGQGIMAIMNKWLPLAEDEQGNKTRLKYRFEGEHAKWKMEEVDELDRNDQRTGKKVWVRKLVVQSTRKVIVTGRMKGEADVLEYVSPEVALINNKKSPLWQEDEDQQLIYWASRRWQRRHWPEGLLGIYDPEEAAVMHQGADNAKLIDQTDRAQALMDRLASRSIEVSNATEGAPIREGFTPEHAHRETAMQIGDERVTVVGDAKVEVSDDGKGATIVAGEAGAVVQVEPAAADGKKPRKKRGDAEKVSIIPPKDEPSIVQWARDGDHDGDGVVLPKSPAEWKVYATAWIDEAKRDPKVPKMEMDHRWTQERKLRNDCGVTSDVKDPVFEYYQEVFHAKPD